MTPTSTTTAAETIFVSTLMTGTPAETFRLDMEGTLGDPDHRVLVLRAAAEQLLRDLAAQLGYTVLSPGQRAQLTEDVALTVARADVRKNAIVTGEYAYDSGYQSAGQSGADDVRDLRTELRAAGVLA